MMNGGVSAGTIGRSGAWASAMARAIMNPGAGSTRHQGEHSRIAGWLEQACHHLSNERWVAARLAEELAVPMHGGSHTRAPVPALKEVTGCFQHNVERMNYAIFRLMNFLIGSGVKEVCKKLVKLRSCGNGMK